MKKLFLLPLLVFVLGKSSKAQNADWRDQVTNQKSLHFNVGTQGVGAEFAYGVLPKMSLRLGANIIPVSADNVFSVSGFNSNSRMSANFSNIHLLADFIPFKSAPGFRLVGGAGYFINAKGKIAVQPKDNYTYGDIVLNNEEVGNLNMNVNWRGFAPYAGIGLLKPFSNRTFNVNLDLGTYFLKQPDANITASGILSGNTSQSAQLQQNLKGYRFLPVVQLNFNFRIQ
ncbi:hypothetical protein [Mucilaginibacter rubeus]|uniref:hypothetical protein n=1 Tax=Mucilaginibacter rubeus TaxID=2027860 RepID=UPI001CC1FDC1|nr:hypothetical protein [Mucilaginibacter rubeus]